MTARQISYGGRFRKYQALQEVHVEKKEYNVHEVAKVPDFYAFPAIQVRFVQSVKKAQQ
jgi:hypothetical protein